MEIKENPLYLKALEFAKKAHKGQKRKSGEDYIVHPIEVSEILIKKFNDLTLAIAGLLHDTVEDCESISIEDIYNEFGKEVGFIVDANTKFNHSFYEFPDMYFEDKVDRLMWAGMKDVRVFLLKIADRQHNFSTIKYLKKNKQIRMGFETQAIYEPLKNLLDYDNISSINIANKNLNIFIKKNKIELSSQVKEFLYSQSFKNFSNELFNFVYKNSSSIIWRVDSIEMYKRLCNDSSLKNNIDVISIRSNGTWFYADFKFMGGSINKDIRLSLVSFNSK